MFGVIGAFNESVGGKIYVATARTACLLYNLRICIDTFHFSSSIPSFSERGVRDFVEISDVLNIRKWKLLEEKYHFTIIFLGENFCPDFDYACQKYLT